MKTCFHKSLQKKWTVHKATKHNIDYRGRCQMSKFRCLFTILHGIRANIKVVLTRIKIKSLLPIYVYSLKIYGLGFTASQIGVNLRHIEGSFVKYRNLKLPLLIRKDLVSLTLALEELYLQLIQRAFNFWVIFFLYFCI